MGHCHNSKKEKQSSIIIFMELISKLRSKKQRKSMYAALHVLRKHNLLQPYLEAYFGQNKNIRHDMGWLDYFFTAHQLIFMTIDWAETRQGSTFWFPIGYCANDLGVKFKQDSDIAINIITNQWEIQRKKKTAIIN